MPDLTEAQQEAIYAMLTSGFEAENIVHMSGVTLRIIEDICGERGHNFEDGDSGDGPWMQSHRCCVFCGAYDDDDGEP